MIILSYELCYVAISNVSIQFLMEEGQSEWGSCKRSD